jgi:sugar (pentulose or hexulose) kinase
MVHCNNCTTDSNAWVSVLGEAARLFGADPSSGQLYQKLYEKSLEGDADCGGVMVCNYLAGEGITDLDAGRPLVVRSPESRFTLANFFRAQIYSALATLALGMDILAQENVVIRSLTGHGGLFKTPGVGQRYLAAACNAPVTCMASAGEGGPYGMALLVAYMAKKACGESLEHYLESRVFADVPSTVMEPVKEDVDGFRVYLDRYSGLLKVERLAVEVM